MNTEKQLGKIEQVTFGLGGYQDAMIGLHVTLSGEGWGVCTDKSTWDCSMIECSPHAKWTEADRSRQYDEIVRYVSDLLAKAKVRSVDALKGIPVEATFEGHVIKSWRVLTEVL